MALRYVPPTAANDLKAISEPKSDRPKLRLSGDWESLTPSHEKKVKEVRFLPRSVRGSGLATGRRSRAVRGARHKGGKKGGGSRVPHLPPQIEVVDAVPFRRRFVINASTSNQGVTRIALASSLGTIATSTTIANVWASSFRIRRLILWQATESGAMTQQNGLYWDLGGTAEQALQKESVKVSTIPAGITVDTPIVLVPKRGTYFAMWQTVASNPTDVLFFTTAQQGSVLDVEGVYTLMAASADAASVTSSSLTVGQPYYFPLDGPGGKWVVQGLPTK